MADHDTPLRFRHAAHPPGPLALRFGAAGDAPPAPDVLAGLHGRLTGLRGHVGAAALVQARLHGRITGLGGHMGTVWDSHTDRPERAAHASHWQPARAAGVGTTALWRRAQRSGTRHASHWQPAQRAAAAHAAGWRDTLRQLATASSHWQTALGQGAASGANYQQALRQLASAAAHYQDALARAALDAARYQQTMRRAAPVGGRYQQAIAQAATAAALYHLRALRRLASGQHHYQDARRPPHGLSPRPDTGPPRPPVCYDPLAPLALRFIDPAHPPGPLALRFICHRWAGGVDPEQPPDTIVVTRRRSYIVLTDLQVLRADTGQPLPALVDGFGMRLDRSSWTWDFSFNAHAAALPLLQPGEDGLPRELEVRVNGQAFRMLAESRARSTRYPRSVLRVGGRGKAALLDAPYADVRSFTQPAARTAQQLMLDALTINGVSIGWTVDWGLTDWPVPADTWAHQGSGISAINDIAASVGAYVQPHDTDPVLRILPGYPVRSWELASATPDIELPPGIATVEEVEWVSKPAYDSLYLHGEPGTYMYFRKRAGTPGSVPAPMAVHPLLVHTDAAAQRAIAELSDTGRQVQQRLTLPVLPATGIIKPGQLLRYTDDADVVRTGVVRGVSVGSGPARIEQTLEVQAHE